jgi:hypothetical protein
MTLRSANAAKSKQKSTFLAFAPFCTMFTPSTTDSAAINIRRTRLIVLFMIPPHFETANFTVAAFLQRVVARALSLTLPKRVSARLSFRTCFPLLFSLCLPVISLQFFSSSAPGKCALLDSRLSRSFAKFERSKTKLNSRLSTWPEIRLKHRPDSSRWSALQVLDHLVKVERALLSDLKSHLPDGKPVSFKERCGALVVNLVMRSPVRVKVPAGASVVIPNHDEALFATFARWDAIRLEMSSVLDSLSPSQLTRGFCRHPVAGWMTPLAALAFLRCHLRHHLFQIDRIERASSGL